MAKIDIENLKNVLVAILQAEKEAVTADKLAHLYNEYEGGNLKSIARQFGHLNLIPFLSSMNDAIKVWFENGCHFVTYFRTEDIEHLHKLVRGQKKKKCSKTGPFGHRFGKKPAGAGPPPVRQPAGRAPSGKPWSGKPSLEKSSSEKPFERKPLASKQTSNSQRPNLRYTNPKPNPSAAKQSINSSLAQANPKAHKSNVGLSNGSTPSKPPHYFKVDSKNGLSKPNPHLKDNPSNLSKSNSSLVSGSPLRTIPKRNKMASPKKNFNDVNSSFQTINSESNWDSLASTSLSYSNLSKGDREFLDFSSKNYLNTSQIEQPKPTQNEPKLLNQNKTESFLKPYQSQIQNENENGNFSGQNDTDSIVSSHFPSQQHKVKINEKIKITINTKDNTKTVKMAPPKPRVTLPQTAFAQPTTLSQATLPQTTCGNLDELKVIIPNTNAPSPQSPNLYSPRFPPGHFKKLLKDLLDEHCLDVPTYKTIEIIHPVTLRKTYMTSVKVTSRSFPSKKEYPLLDQAEDAAAKHAYDFLKDDLILYREVRTPSPQEASAELIIQNIVSLLKGEMFSVSSEHLMKEYLKKFNTEMPNNWFDLVKGQDDIFEVEVFKFTNKSKILIALRKELKEPRKGTQKMKEAETGIVTEKKVDGQVNGHVNGQLNTQITSQVYSSIKSQVDDQMNNAQISQVYGTNTQDTSLRNQINGQINGNMKGQMKDKIVKPKQANNDEWEFWE